MVRLFLSFSVLFDVVMVLVLWRRRRWQGTDGMVLLFLSLSVLFDVVLVLLLWRRQGW